jgi:hypothetical protein
MRHRCPLRGTRKKPGTAVRASERLTTVRVSLVIAYTIIGDVAWCPASGATLRRLQRHRALPMCPQPEDPPASRRRRGNRRINHAIHGCNHPDPPAQRRPALPRREGWLEERPRGGRPVPQAADQRHHLRRLQADSRQAAAAAAAGPGGQPGTTLHPARPAHTPHAGSSDKPLPDPPPRYGPAPRQAHPHRRSRPQRKPGQPLDSKSKEDSICTPVAARRLALGAPRSVNMSQRRADEPPSWFGAGFASVAAH